MKKTLIGLAFFGFLSITPGYSVERSEQATGDVAVMPDTVPYYIITVDSLAPAFQQLADYKTRKGTYTKVKRISEIESSFPTEPDTPAKIRKFIQNAYSVEKTRWVLLGGDVGLIPARRIWSKYGNYVITDYYYSCIDGSWNTDGDTMYAEVGVDSTDLIPDVYVGRIPVVNSSQVSNYTNKYLDYERDMIYQAYRKKALFLSSKVYKEGDGQEFSDSLANHVPGNFQKSKLYEYPSQQGIDSLNTGFGLVFNNSHAQGPYNFLTIYDIRDDINNGEIDGLSNVLRYSVMVNSVCYDNNLEADCLSKHFILHPYGGGVAYVGSSKYDLPKLTQTIHKGILDQIFLVGNARIGKALAQSKLLLVSGATKENASRNALMTYSLLGDPEMEVWSDTAKDDWQKHPTSLYNGTAYTFDDTVREITGQPISGATVCLMKGTEVYQVKTTNSSGVATFTVTFPTTGTATTFATKTGFIPDSSAISIVNPPGGPPPSCPYVYVWTGSSFEEDNVILTQAEYAPKEAVVTDFYQLTKNPEVKDNAYRLQIKELVQEKSFIDNLELLVIDHPADKRSGVSSDGKMFLIGEELVPISAIDQYGNEQIEKLSAVDNDYFAEDGFGYLVLTFQTGEKGKLVFGGPAPAKSGKCPPNDESAPGDSGLVIDPGPGGWINQIEGQKQIDILKVQVESADGHWIDLPTQAPRENGALGYWVIEPEYVKSHGTFRVRLSWNKGYKADVIKLYVEGESVPEPKTVALGSAYHNKLGKCISSLSSSDNVFATLVKGEMLDLSFPANNVPLQEGYTRDFVVKASGYYIPFAEEDASTTPNTFQLFDNYPNPFNVQTQIQYNLPASAKVELSVYNTLGQKVRILVNEEQTTGTHSVIWDGKNDKGETVASGVYFYALKAGAYTETKKMTLLK